MDPRIERIHQAADFVKKIAPDSVDQHVDGVRDKLDGMIGNDGA